MRINESPIVETHLVKSAEAPGGIGEAPTAAISSSGDKRHLRRHGQRIRTLPIDRALKEQV
jgi:isoquinoline 1-oxidoreductase beta subunit